jgi:adenosine deaminase
LRRLARDRILVEVCLTSNLQTGAVQDLRQHPLPVFMEYGVPCTLCTDNTTVSSTSLIQEYLLAVEVFGLGEEDVRSLVEEGKKYSFLISA